MIRVLMALAAILTASAASAADLGGPPPAPTGSTVVEAVRPVGCYVDAGIGFGVTTSEFKADDVKLPLSPNGTLASIGGGCDLRMSGWILGGFGTYAFGEMTTQALDVTRMTYTTDNVWAIGGRVGYLIQEPTLLYVRLGYAGAAAKLSEDDAKVFDKRLNGLMIGAGLETRISGPLHFRFGLDAYLWGTEGLDSGAVKAESRTITTTAGIVFKF